MKNKLLLSILLLLNSPIDAKLSCNEFDCKHCCEVEEDFYPDTTKAFNESIPGEVNNSQNTAQTIHFCSEDIALVNNNRNITFAYLPDQVKNIILDILKTKNLEFSVALKNLNEYVKKDTNIIPKNEGLQVFHELLTLVQKDEYLNPEILKFLTDYQAQVQSESMNLSPSRQQDSNNLNNITEMQVLTANNAALNAILQELRDLKSIVLDK